MGAPAAHVPTEAPEAAAHGWPALPAPFLVGTALLAVVAGLAGWLGREVTAPAPIGPPPPARTVSLGPVELTAPGSWAPVHGGVAGVPALGVRSASFAPVPGLDARAVLALAPFQDASLVPAPLRPLAGDSRPSETSLAGMRAWAYRPQPLAGGRIAQLTVAPTTAGSVAAICIAPAGAWSGAAACAQDLEGASLKGASPLIPSPTLAFRLSLPPAMDRLNRRRADLRAKLRAAATPRGQARFATRLAVAHERAAAALAPRAPASGPAARVVERLRGAAPRYRRLSLAARKGLPARYRRARAAIRRSDRMLSRALAQVR